MTKALQLDELRIGRVLRVIVSVNVIIFIRVLMNHSNWCNRHPCHGVYTLANSMMLNMYVSLFAVSQMREKKNKYIKK